MKRNSTLLLRGIPVLLGCLAIAALNTPSARAAAGQYDVAPPPAWVETTYPESSSAGDTNEGGTRYLLVDNQVRLDRIEYAYTRLVMELKSVSGVEDNSEISISFDPKRERLHLHSAVIRRGNLQIDELKAGRIQVLRKESELENGILDGELTFSLIMSDVRVGDIVDYSYTLDRRDGEWGDRHYGRYQMEWQDPIGFERLRFSWPQGAVFHVLNKSDVAPRMWESEGWSYWEWSKSGVAGKKTESDTPRWVEQLLRVQYSQFQDWPDVARQALPLYKISAADVAAASSVARDETRGMSSDEERVVAVMKFVQSEVRYTGIEEGEGAFRPTAPRVVLERRYGDCKDKTLLAVTMLRALNIKADPALVSTRWQAAAAEQLPSPGVMNHVVVHAAVGNKPYWFDATTSGQEGTLQNFTQAHFGRALTVAADTRELEAMPNADTPYPTLDAEEVFDFSPGHAQAQLTVTTRYLGQEADGLRRRLASKGQKSIADSYFDYYKDRYPKLERLSAVSFRDDAANNVVTVREKYEITDAFTTGKGNVQTFKVFADSIVDLLSAPSATRRQPYSIDYPDKISQRIRLLMHEPWPIEGGDLRIDTPEFHYDSAADSRGGEIVLSYNYYSKADHVPVKRIAAYIKDAGKAHADANFRLKFDPGAPLAGTTPSSIKIGAVLVAFLLLAFFLVRLIPYWFSARILLGMRLRDSRAVALSDADVPAEDEHFLTSLDPTLTAMGFSPLGFLQYTARGGELTPFEYLRLLADPEKRIAAAVKRHPLPEVGRYTQVSFETVLADGRILISAQEPIDKHMQPLILAEHFPSLALGDLYQAHCRRLKSFETIGYRTVDLNPSAHAWEYNRISSTYRDRLLALGLLTKPVSENNDRFTLKGVWHYARLAVDKMRVDVRAARREAGATPGDYAERVRADLLGVAHTPRGAPQAHRIYWPLTAFTMLTAAVALALVAILATPTAASSLLVATLIHEGGHLAATRAFRVKSAPLFLLPLLGILTADSGRTLATLKRALIVAAGPLTGFAAGAALSVASAHCSLAFLSKTALILLGITGLSLVPVEQSDGMRLMDIISRPTSRWRLIYCGLLPIPLIGIAVLQPSEVAGYVALLWLVFLYANMRRLLLLRRVALAIPAGADWDTAVRSALEAMTAPPYRRWRAGTRRVRAIAIADQFMDHASRRASPIGDARPSEMT